MASSKKKAPLYFTVYSFMQRDLKLSGITRDVLAIIFGFWKRSRMPVHVPYSIMREMTGATDPSISAAIQRLEKHKLISKDSHVRGLKSLYTVTLPPEVLAEFENDYLRDVDSDSPDERQTRKSVPTASAYDPTQNTIP